MNWSAFKTMVRRSRLADEGETAQFSSEKLLDCFGDAQRELAAHTAKPSVYSIVSGTVKNPLVPGVLWDLGIDREFPLPTDLYETVDITGIVYTTDADGENPVYYDPFYYSPNLTPLQEHDQGFWCDSANLYMTEAPGTGKTLWIRYFAYWPEPDAADDDTFVLAVPAWAIGPLAYLTAAHCLSNLSTKSSRIRQWNERSDSGRPTDNVLMQQQEQYLRLYEVGIARHTRQDRANFFRATS